MSTFQDHVTQLGRSAAFEQAHRPVSTLWLVLTAASERLSQWLDRVHERHDLSRLSDFQLKDVGLSRADIEREVSKPFWRA